jgi:3-dehydroquinate dehydratase-2
MKRVLVIHGPNLNLLGKRRPDIYGRDSLADIDRALSERAAGWGFDVECVQTNHEGEIIGHLHRGRSGFHGVLLNPGGYTHTSVAIRDAVEASTVPVIEVHLSNLHAREPFRSRSVTAAPAAGVVMGLGKVSYLAALCALSLLLETRTPAARRRGYTVPEVPANAARRRSRAKRAG